MLLLLVPSFFAAWAEDEGTIGNSKVGYLFAKIFSVLRFPTHTLLWSFFSESGVLIYILGLIGNCFIYSITLERVIAVCYRLRKNKAVSKK